MAISKKLFPKVDSLTPYIFYKFNNNLNDEQGNHDGSGTSGFSYGSTSPVVEGQYVQWNGTANPITAGTYEMESGDSLSMFIYRALGVSDERIRIFGNHGTTSYEYVSLAIQYRTSGFQIRTFFRNDISNFKFYYSTSQTISMTAGNWHHFTFNFPSLSELNSSSNLPTNTITLNGNDIEMYRAESGGTLTSLVSGDPMRIGVNTVLATQGSYNAPTSGHRFDYMKIFQDYHLTADDIAALGSEV
jgi:hypothetical protein